MTWQWAGAATSQSAGTAPSLQSWEPNDGLPSSVVTGIIQTEDGFLWVGTLDGLARFDGMKFKAYTPQNFAGMRTNRIRLLIPSRSGGAWVVMDKGPVIRLEHGKSPQVVSDGYPEIATSAVEDRSGALWIGYQHTSARQLSDGKMTAIAVADAPAGSDSYVDMDSAGTIWLGQGGIVYHKVGDNFVNAHQFSNLPMALAGARDEGMWVYCENKLVKFDSQGKMKEFGSPPVALNNLLSTDLYVDRNGTVWVGAWHGGLFKFDGGNFEPVTTTRSGHAFGGLEDAQGNLWIRTVGDGMLRMRAVVPNAVSTPAVLEEVEADGRVLADYGGILPTPNVRDLSVSNVWVELPPENHELKFDFTCLNLVSPEKVRFRYRLEGLDRDWIDAQKNRTIVYSQLAHGNYRFRVQASDDGKAWREASNTIAMKVLPFFWQTWWFWLAVASGFFAFVVGVRYVSIRRLQSQLRATEQKAALEQERSRIAKDLHDDLGGSLTQVSLLLELAQRNPEKASERLQQMSGTLRQVNESLDEIVWAVNPHNDSLPHLINYLGQFAIEFLQSAGIRCRVDLPDNPPQRTVSPEMRHNLFLMLKEALNNIVRHARATEVWFRVKLQANAMEVLIEDNGEGMRHVETAAGNGLGNMRHRVEEIGGRFDIESGSAGGTRISANVPCAGEPLSR